MPLPPMNNTDPAAEKLIVTVLLDTTQCDDLSCDNLANNPEHMCEYHEAKDKLFSYIRTLEARNEVLEKALKAAHDWRGLCDSCENDTFERIGEMFFKDTGFLRIGKSESPAVYSDGREKRRTLAWNEWVERKNDELNKQIRDALSLS